LVIVSGDTTTGGSVDAISVIVNPPEGGGTFGGGGFAGRGGLGGGAVSIGIVSGSVSQAGENQITVTTESGETQVNLGDDLAGQVYSPGEVGDISAGDRVLVITADDNESGNPVTTTSVIVNPPEGGAVRRWRRRVWWPASTALETGPSAIPGYSSDRDRST